MIDVGWAHRGSSFVTEQVYVSEGNRGSDRERIDVGVVPARLAELEGRERGDKELLDRGVVHAQQR